MTVSVYAYLVRFPKRRGIISFLRRKQFRRHHLLSNSQLSMTRRSPHGQLSSGAAALGWMSKLIDRST